MRIWHMSKLSYVEGKLSEADKIEAWKKEMTKVTQGRFDCFVDESEGDTLSFIWTIEFSTQVDRQEYAQLAKKKLKGAKNVS